MNVDIEVDHTMLGHVREEISLGLSFGAVSYFPSPKLIDFGHLRCRIEIKP